MKPSTLINSSMFFQIQKFVSILLHNDLIKTQSSLSRIILYFTIALVLLSSCDKGENNQLTTDWQDISITHNVNLTDIDIINEDIAYIAGNGTPTPIIHLLVDYIPSDTNYIKLDNSIPLLTHKDSDTNSIEPLMFKTSDGGQTWQPILLPFSKYLDMSFVDAQNGFVLSSGGLYRTNDGGENWTKIIENKVGLSSNQIAHAFDHIKFISPDYGYLYSNDFLGFCLFATISGDGNSWSIIRNGYNLTDSIFNVVFDIEQIPGQPQSAYILDMKNLYFSSDKGVNWIQKGEEKLLRDISVLDNNNLFAVFSNNINKTTDGGQNWIGVSSQPISPSVLYAVDQNILFFSDMQNIYKSEDGGLTARKMSKPEKYINEMKFLNSRLGFAIGPSGTVLRYELK